MTADEKKLEEQTDQILVKVSEHVESQKKKWGEYDAEKAENKLFQEKITTDLQAIDDKITKKGEDDTERFERIEKRVNTAATGSPDGEDVAAIEVKTINDWMRTGNISLEKEDRKKYGFALKDKEIKIMSVSDDPDAGYLKKPPQYLNEIIKEITEHSPVRQMARVFSSDKDIYAPKRTAVATASGRSEKGSMTEETTRKYGMEVMTVHEMYVKFNAYHWMIEDSTFNLASEAQQDAAEAFAVKEGTWFVNGTGIGEPEGIMDNPDVSSRNQEETSTLTDPKAVMLLAYDINDQYTMDEANCAYMMRRATFGTIRTMQAGDGHFYLQTMDERGERRIEGFKVVTAPDMDAVGANTYPVVFGNFKKGYWILDRLSMWILRDPYTNADDGYETFKFRRRTNGQVVQPNAFYKLKIAVT
jgi:HK97 family phage major capsid protein